MPKPAFAALPQVRLFEDLDPPQAPILAVTVPDAQRVSGLGRTSIYDAITRGEIEAVKAGTRTLILMDSLRTYLMRLPRFRTTA